MVYDVYYTTGGGPWISAGTDAWVNLWIELVAPKLEVKPILIIHRNKPKRNKDYQFPIETYWHGDDIEKVEELCRGARRINILHGHYTPMKILEENKDKIYSNVIHTSVDYILKSQVGSDSKTGWSPYMDKKWETEINSYAKHSIWIGLFEILIKNINIRNFYEFRHNLPLSESNNIGFAARCEGRKNPHYLDGIPAYIFTDYKLYSKFWKQKEGIDTSKHRIYNYQSDHSNKFWNMNWGISHSAFQAEPFGYSIFQSVDYGKLPILHSLWCKDFEYPYRASNKKEFVDIYNKIKETSYEEKNKWFLSLKQYMIDNFTDKDKWVKELLHIYNG